MLCIEFRGVICYGRSKNEKLYSEEVHVFVKHVTCDLAYLFTRCSFV